LLKPEAIDDYCTQVSKTEKRRLYDVFASETPDKIQELVAHINETVMTARPEKSEPDGAANRSQPIRSETNRTSAAAGSDR
jgi:hypothetical protein